MTGQRLVEVTLAMAWGPGAPQGNQRHHIVFTAALDAQGCLEQAAWLADPAPWPARLERPETPPRQGDVTHDEDGWGLRFFDDATAAADAPLHRLVHAGPLRPGEVLTIRDPEGAEAAWRVVGVG